MVDDLLVGQESFLEEGGHPFHTDPAFHCTLYQITLSLPSSLMLTRISEITSELVHR